MATIVAGPIALTVVAQQPISKGQWTRKIGKPYRVDFQYGTNLTAHDIETLAACDSLTEIVMGYAELNLEYVTVGCENFR